MGWCVGGAVEWLIWSCVSRLKKERIFLEHLEIDHFSFSVEFVYVRCIEGLGGEEDIGFVLLVKLECRTKVKGFGSIGEMVHRVEGFLRL